MAEQLTDEPEVRIHGPVSPEDADTLFRAPPESAEAQAVLTGIGATAGKESVALVTAADEAGKELPSHFVTLDPHDMGTTLDPEGGAADLRLPSPEAAHAELAAKQEQPKH